MNISAHEIHLWVTHSEAIVDSATLSRYFPLLNEQESIQQKRFHFEKDRHQYLVTRALVRSVLSLYAPEIAPEDWTFKKNDYGKPSISNSDLSVPLTFNLSHTEKLIVMAVTLDQEVGVDVEYLPRMSNMLSIANSFFSQAEVTQLFDLPPDKQNNRAFDLWTLKEAYIKACGKGLSIPLNQFTYSFSPQGKIDIEFMPERNDQPEYWRFWQVRPTKVHKISLALKSKTIDDSYSVKTREIVPLVGFKEVDYPIGCGEIVSME
jgi:4'-phosphopantetheinyl transferase